MAQMKFKMNDRAVLAAMERAAERGVKKAAEHVMGESQDEVPLEESTLQRSAHTEVERKRGSVDGTVSYDTPYAVVQHERLDFKHDPGRKAKYLEDPLFREAGQIVRIIGNEVAKEL